jgi:glycerol-3-phosphate acyltransferase PlsY
LIFAYLVGGIPFGWLAGQLSGKGDIRRLGSGNIGATNVWRVVGPVPAILVVIGDVGKGILGVAVADFLYQPVWPVGETTACLLAGIMAVVGHVFCPYLSFHGGKGVNTALGMFIYLLPLESLAALGVFMIVVAVSRYVSLGSMTAAAAFALAVWIRYWLFDQAGYGTFLAISALLALFIIYTHRENIKRLMHGTENRIRWREDAP